MGTVATALEVPASPAMVHLTGTVPDASGKPASHAVVGIAAKTDVYLQIQRSGGLLFDQGHAFR